MKNKYKITLFNENQYTKKELIGTPISHKTACRLYNSLTNPPFKQDPHQFKCHDSFSVKDSRIRLITCYGSKVDKVVYHDGTVKEDIIGEFQLIGDKK
jgi:hypothetical protein